MSKEGILQEVSQERNEQDHKWGEQNHKPIEWIAILTEEVGEAAKEAVDYHFKYPVTSKEYNDYTLEDISHNINEIRLKRYRTELIQVAAVAVQMIESVDRNELKLENHE